MATVTRTTWEQLNENPIASRLEPPIQLALVCEYVDFLRECHAGGIEPVSLDEFIAGTLGEDGEPAQEPAPEPVPESRLPAPWVEESVPAEKPRTRERKPRAEKTRAEKPDEIRPIPASVATPAEPLLGKRVVYRFPGNAILSDAAGVTQEDLTKVGFTDVEGQPWSNVGKANVAIVDPANTIVLHISPREAQQFDRWLLEGVRDPDAETDEVLRHLAHEFPEGGRLVLAIVNDDQPYVDRYVEMAPRKYEDDQKPTRRIFGDHVFRCRGADYIVRVETP